MMEQDFIERMKQSLSAFKMEIVNNLMASSEDFKKIMEEMDPKDVVDTASDDMDRRMIAIMGAQELKRLKLIEAALGRIDQGRYGYCMRCGKKIPQDRLEAIPYAVLCIDCKSSEERRTR
jgi:RNA polymerase-binding protein DksA